VATLLSPRYAAVVEWFPAFSADVENIATPFTSAAVPIIVLPSRNCTDPVSVVLAGFVANRPVSSVNRSVHL
jgi:hypothetical protein